MKSTKARHLARATRATRKAEKDAAALADHYAVMGRPVPPGRGRHRKWTPAEAVRKVIDDLRVQLGFTR